VTKAELRIHNVDRLDRGLAYGEACFETFRVIDGEVLALERHLDRLAMGMATFGIEYDLSDLATIADEAMAAGAAVGRDAVVRITVTGGTAPWGLLRRGQPEFFVQCMSYAAKLGTIELESVEWPFPLLPKKAKFTGDYALVLRALHQWDVAGEKVPLICRDGVVLSSLTANVLILRDGQWYTPDDSGGGVLPGVIRSLLIEKGVVEPAVCPVAWLGECEAMMLTNSSLFAAAVDSVDGREMASMHSSILVVQDLLKMYPGVLL